MNNTVEIQDSMRDKIAAEIRGVVGHLINLDEALAAADAILALEPISAGIGLYLASIETEEPR